MSKRHSRVSGQPGTAAPVAPALSSNFAKAPDFTNELLTAMLSFQDGNFAARMPSSLLGVEGKIADTFNDIVSFSERRSKETVRVSRSVGKEGKLKQRMIVPEALGGWADEVGAINML